MQSFTIAATVAAVATASASDFPKNDSFHAYCQMSVTYTNTLCMQLYWHIDYEILTWMTGGPSGGLYAVYESHPVDYIWSTRTTPINKYIDDQIFVLTQDGDNCNVAAKSRSRTNSYYDYDTNYCNMWNVLNSVAQFENLTTSECQWVPEDAVATCAIY